MEALLELLQKNARLTNSELADRLGTTAEAIAAQIAAFESDKAILGYNAVVDPDKTGSRDVSALIEVRLRPEREGGFDHLAERISKFAQVTNCYLMSGGYDLAVIVEGPDLREVASFVSEKLSTIDGVLSTATHFQLKVYKQAGFLAETENELTRLPVTP
ncbi:MAG: Lrp/AsnC family transcriptional regulator [Verrucomicrobiales bacterium]